VPGEIMSQESNRENISAEKAILERLKCQNLSLGDLLASKAFATIAKCDAYIIGDINDAIGNLENSKMPKEVI
jgi:hypothetical protein